MAFTLDDIAGSARVLLGHSELLVRPVGLGCMGMSRFYGAADDAQSTRTIREALDLGIDFIDTADHLTARPICWSVTRTRGLWTQ